MIKEKMFERKDEFFVSEGDVVCLDEDYFEEKVFKEKENLEQKVKQKVCGDSFIVVYLFL